MPGNDGEMGRISDEVCKKYGFSGDDPIDPRTAAIIEAEVRERFEKHRQSRPYVEEVSKATMQHIFERKQ